MKRHYWTVRLTLGATFLFPGLILLTSLLVNVTKPMIFLPRIDLLNVSALIIGLLIDHRKDLL